MVTNTLPVTPLTPAPTYRSIDSSPGLLTPSPKFVDRLQASITKESTYKDESQLAAVFAVHDILIRNPSANVRLPWTNIVSVGGQSAGKSSLLSALANVPLWTAATQATCGPTQIHSRHRPGTTFTAAVEIEWSDPPDGVPKWFSFTQQALTSKEGLAEVLRLAGDEARRLDRLYTTYEHLLPMSVSERQTTTGSLAEFTPNVVILHISGPEQRNMSIIDLPGLNGDEVAENLANTYLSKPENLILFCVPAGGSDPSTKSDELKIIRRFRPGGERSIGVITKADQIQDPLESTLTEIIRGAHPKWPWKPQYGFHPFIAPPTSGFAPSADFNQEGWKKVSSEVGFEFGTKALRERIYTIFEQLVVEASHGLQSQISSQSAELDVAIGQLPPLAEQPVGLLHGTILEIHRELLDCLTEKAEFADILNDLQVKLRQDLFDTIPTFVPHMSEDTEIVDGYTGYWSPEWPERDATKEEHILLDEIAEGVAERTQKRNGTVNMQEIRIKLIRRFASTWLTVCQDHIDAVWKVLDRAAHQVTEKIVGDKAILVNRIESILAEQHGIFKISTMELAARICKRERTDPNTIDLISNQHRALTAKVRDTIQEGYEAVYLTNRAAPKLSPTQVNACFDIASSVTTNLVRGAYRVSEIVGREAMAQCLEYIDAAVPALRKGFELENVEERVLKRTRDLYEPDVQSRLQREKLAKRQADLAHVSERLRVAERL